MRLSSSLAENLFFLAHICFWCHKLCLNPDLGSLLVASSSQKMAPLQVQYSGKWCHSWRCCLVDELIWPSLVFFVLHVLLQYNCPWRSNVCICKEIKLALPSFTPLDGVSINTSGRPVLPVLLFISDYCMSFMTGGKLLCSKVRSYWKVCVLFYLFVRKLVLQVEKVTLMVWQGQVGFSQWHKIMHQSSFFNIYSREWKRNENLFQSIQISFPCNSRHYTNTPDFQMS